jgi:eukaryotic-like serine/threonine-protein kinase
LVERFLQSVSRRSGVLVLTGRCYEQETLPYKGIDGLIDQLSRLLSTPSFRWSEAMMPRDAAALAAMFPVLDNVPLFAEARRGSSVLSDRVELRRRAFLALREMLGSMGRRVRLILWLDDLQWADQESAKLLSEVLRGPDSPHLLLVCTYRSEGAEVADSALHALLETLEREPVVKTRIALEPLSTGDAALLAQSMLRGTGEASNERALAIANDSGGVPFFIRELARAASAYTGAKLPLESLIWIRVTELDPEPRRLMHLIAIAGRPVTQMSVFAAAGIESRSPAILNILTNAGLLCSRGPASSDTVEPFHDRIREAIVARIDESQKRTLHQQLAEALERDPHADVELMAAHFEAGGELRRAGAYYQQAADRAAASVAFNRAAELYGRTLRLREWAPAERAAVELKLAEALANAGRSADASHHYLAAAEHLPAHERLYNEGLAVYHLCVGGYLDEGRGLIDKLLIKIGRRPVPPGLQTIAGMLWLDLRCRYRGTRQPARRPEDVEAILLAQIDLLWFAAAGLGVSDLVGGFRLLLLSMELAQKAREPVRMIRAYAWHAALQVGRRSGSKQIDQTFERCRELSKSVGEPPPSRATLALTTAVRYYLVGSWAEALPACMQAERIIVEECRGFNWELAFTRGLKLTLLMNKGEVNGLEDEARAMADDALSRGDLATATLIASLALPYSQIVADKPALARTTWQHWIDRWPSHQVKSNQEPYAVLINVWSHLYEDNVEAAFEILQQRWKSAIASSHNLRLPVASV